MAAGPLRDSSSNVYNSQWKAFAKWVNGKGIHSKDLSYVTLAKYLVHLFAENKQVNTIKYHRSSIASVLKMLNPPTALKENTIHNIIRRMSILRPRTQEIIPRWHLSIVLKGLMKPPFIINGSDRDLPLDLLFYKTAFLVALATGARGWELIALSRAAHNLDFTTLVSGAKQVSIRTLPKFIPKNQRLDIIPKPLEFQGIAHLFPKYLERLLCPVRVLGLYLIRSAERAKEDRSTKETFCAFLPRYPTLHHPLLVLGGRDYLPYLRKLVWIWPFQDSSPWCKSGGCLHSLLQKYSVVWAMWSDQMEVLQRFRPTLPERHSGRHWASGHPPGGRSNSYLDYSSLTTSTNVIQLW